jgi:hypothetical protein
VDYQEHPVKRIERAAPFLDERVVLVQEGPDAWAEEPGATGRPWANLSIRYTDAIAPEGWFFLYESIGSRKTIADCIKNGALEIESARFTMSDGGGALLARVVPD